MTTSQSAQTFGELLRQKRNEARLTQEKLAARSGLAARTISDLERGLVAAPRWDTVRQLATGLGLRGPDQVSFEDAARNDVAGSPPAGADDREGDSFPARHTLPRDIGSFTGRADVLRDLIDAVEADGEATVIHAIGGMAGVGKTTLAIRAAHELADRFPDGQFFVQLHGHAPGLRPVAPTDALASLLMTAGLAAQRIPPELAARMSLWRDHLAGKRVLLLLDDASGSAQVQPLLPGNRRSLVLITSRRHLTALDDAHAISLAALRPDEAAELLIRLAARPGLEADDIAIAEIVRLCGYLPLAVGMLARQLHHHPAWTCARLAADLATARNRLDLMQAEDVSVSAAFDLSYQDLTEEQRRLFRRLSLHPGPDLDAHAAAALDGTDLAAARRTLAALYDHYLLSEPAQGRYLMHDLTREHALMLATRQDPSSDREQAIGRLLDYYQSATRAADQLMARYGRPRAEARSHPRRPRPGPEVPDMANDIQALSWARAERASLVACLDYATSTGQPARVVALTAGLAALLRYDGPWADAIARHRIALAAAGQVGDRLGEAAALADLGDLQRATGDNPAADVALRRALDLYTDVGDREGRANTLTDVAALRANTGDHEGAAAAAREAADLYRDLGESLGHARALSIVGYAHCRAGEYQEAIPTLEDSLARYRDLGNQLGLASALNYLGFAQRAVGCYQPATRSLEEALAIHRDIGSRPGQASVLVDIGGLRREIGDYDGAAFALEAALDILPEIGNPDLLSQAYNELGTLCRLRGDLAGARTRHHQALDLARAIGSRWIEGRAMTDLGRCAAAAGRVDEARSWLRQARQIFEQISPAEATGIAAELDKLGGSASTVQASGSKVRPGGMRIGAQAELVGCEQPSSRVH